MNFPKEVTTSGNTYFVNANNTMNLFMFIIDISICSDTTAYIARLALDGEEIPKNVEESEYIKNNPGPRTKYLRTNRQLLLEIFITRLMDNFTTYLSDVVREAFKAKPQILRYKETVRLDQIMKFDSLEDFYQDLIDQEVMRLSFLWLCRARRLVTKKMGIRISPTAQDREAIIEFIETRNIIVHNRGLIGPKYLLSVQNTNFDLGSQKQETFCHPEQAACATRRISPFGVRCFGLKTSPHPQGTLWVWAA